MVTGASAGVGRAVAHAFARRGAHLGLIARGREGLEAAREECEALGGEALVLPADVADAAAVDAAATAIEARFGPLDVWVNDAMATVFASFLHTTAEEYRRATEVTYLGTVHGTMTVTGGPASAAGRRVRHRALRPTGRDGAGPPPDAVGCRVGQRTTRPTEVGSVWWPGRAAAAA